jgi:hypothetical protein
MGQCGCAKEDYTRKPLPRCVDNGSDVWCCFNSWVWGPGRFPTQCYNCKVGLIHRVAVPKDVILRCDSCDDGAFRGEKYAKPDPGAVHRSMLQVVYSVHAHDGRGHYNYTVLPSVDDLPNGR